jgi:2-polyprenyl-6-methoxyphenol hydroxylase-like FAD-dependent oxidoreductase
LTSKKLTNITSDDAGVRVTCADGSVYQGSIVLGADGVHSKTRTLMRRLALAADPAVSTFWDPEDPFTAHYRCLWASFPRPSDPGESFETHSTDNSVMYITGRERGWIFLYEKLPQPTRERSFYTNKDVDAFALKFAEYPVNERLKVKDVYAERLTAGMSDLEEGIAKHWSWGGRIVLAGDAGHKFTPNAGLGFNNGIQDVVALCNGLHKAVTNAGPSKQPDTATLAGVFEEYQSSRSKMLESDYRQSARITRLHAWANSIYYVMARYILALGFVQKLMMNTSAASSIRQGLVLDYIPTAEPLVGRIGWDHPLNSPSAGGEP